MATKAVGVELSNAERAAKAFADAERDAARASKLQAAAGLESARAARLRADANKLATGDPRRAERLAQAELRLAQALFKERDAAIATAASERKHAEALAFADRKADKFGDTIVALGRKVRNILKPLALAAGVFLGVGAAGAKAIDTIRSTVQADIGLAQVEKQIQVGTGSAEAARVAYARLEGQADSLGVAVGGLAGGFSRFLIASKGTNLEGAESVRLFDSLTKASSVLQLSQTDTNRLMNAFVQMMSKGKVQAEELRGQAGDVLPGAFSLAAEAIGVTNAQLDKMLEDGKVMADTLLPALATRLEEVFGPGAAIASVSEFADFQRLNNEFLRLKQTIGAQVAPALAEAAREVGRLFKSNGDLAELLGGALAGSIRLMASLLQPTVDLLKFAAHNTDLLVVALSAFAGLRVAAALQAIVTGLGAYITAAGGATVASRGFAAALGPLGLALTVLTGAAVLANDAIRSLSETHSREIAAMVDESGRIAAAWSTTEDALRNMNRAQLEAAKNSVLEDFARSTSAADEAQKKLGGLTDNLQLLASNTKLSTGELVSWAQSTEGAGHLANTTKGEVRQLWEEILESRASFVEATAASNEYDRMLTSLLSTLDDVQRKEDERNTRQAELNDRLTELNRNIALAEAAEDKQEKKRRKNIETLARLGRETEEYGESLRDIREVTLNDGSARGDLQDQVTELEGLIGAYREGSTALENFTQNQAIHVDFLRLAGEVGTEEALALEPLIRRIHELRASVGNERELASLRQQIELLQVERDVLDNATVAQRMFGEAARQAAREVEIQRRIMAAGPAADQDRIREEVNNLFDLKDEQRQFDELLEHSHAIFSEMKSAASGIFDNMFEDAPEGFRKLLDSLLDMFTDFLAQMAAKNASQGFAQSAAGGVQGAGGSSGAGGSGGLAESGSNAAGLASSGAAAGVAVAAIYFQELANHLEHASARHADNFFRGFAGFDLVMGEAVQFIEGRMLIADEAAQAITQGLQDLVFGISDAMGGILNDIPQILISVSRSGRRVKVHVGEFFLGFFDDVNEAMEDAVLFAIAHSDFSGLGESMQRVMATAASADSVEELMHRIDVAAELDGLTDLSRELVQLQRRATEVEAVVREVGLSFAMYLEWKNKEIAALRDSTREGLLSIAGITNFGSGLAGAIASAEEMNQALEDERQSRLDAMEVLRRQIAEQEEVEQAFEEAGAGVVEVAAEVLGLADSTSDLGERVNELGSRFDGDLAPSMADLRDQADRAGASVADVVGAAAELGDTLDPTRRSVEELASELTDLEESLAGIPDAIPQREIDLAVQGAFATLLSDLADLTGREDALIELQRIKAEIELESLLIRAEELRALNRLSEANLALLNSLVEDAKEILTSGDFGQSDQRRRGARRNRREERQRFRDQAEDFIALAAGMDTLGINTRQSVRDIEEWGEQALRAGLSAAEAAAAMQAQYDLLIDDILGDAQRTVDRQGFSDTENTFLDLFDDFRSQARALAEIGGEEAARALEVLREALLIDFSNLFDDELSRLLEAGDVEGLRELAAFFEGLEVLGLGDFSDELDQINDAIRQLEAEGLAEALRDEVAARREARAQLAADIKARREALRGPLDFAGDVRNIVTEYEGIFSAAAENLSGITLRLNQLIVGNLRDLELQGTVIQGLEGFLSFLDRFEGALPDEQRLQITQALAVAEIALAQARLAEAFAMEEVRAALVGLGLDADQVFGILNDGLDRALDIVTGGGSASSSNTGGNFFTTSSGSSNGTDRTPLDDLQDEIDRLMAAFSSRVAETLPAIIADAESFVADRDALLSALQRSQAVRDQIPEAQALIEEARAGFVGSIVEGFGEDALNPVSAQFQALQSDLLNAATALETVGVTTQEWSGFLLGANSALSDFVANAIRNPAQAQLDQLRGIRGDDTLIRDQIIELRQLQALAAGGDIGAASEALELARQLQGSISGLVGSDRAGVIGELESVLTDLASFEAPTMESLLGQQLDVETSQLVALEAIQASVTQAASTQAVVVQDSNGNGNVTVTVTLPRALEERVDQVVQRIERVVTAVENADDNNTEAIRTATQDLKGSIQP